MLRRSLLCGKSLAAVLGLIVHAGAACAQDWTPMTWAIGSVFGRNAPADTSLGAAPKPERLAFFVPVVVDGTTCAAQIDTGATSSIIWHGPRAPAADSGARSQITAFGKSKQISIPPEIGSRLSNCSPSQPIMTLGNAFFEDGTLTLDFVNSRAQFSKTANLRDKATIAFDYKKVGSEGGQVLLDVTLGTSAAASKVMLDTGSARFGLSIFRKEDWHSAIGERAALRNFEVPSWGRQIPCSETLTTQSIQLVNNLRLQTLISRCEADFQPPAGVVGLLGLASFSRNTVLTIDYPAQKILFEIAP
jgi:hypothetical protein